MNVFFFFILPSKEYVMKQTGIKTEVCRCKSQQTKMIHQMSVCNAEQRKTAKLRVE